MLQVIYGQPRRLWIAVVFSLDSKLSSCHVNLITPKAHILALVGGTRSQFFPQSVFLGGFTCPAMMY